jgi:hypothetical protein
LAKKKEDYLKKKSQLKDVSDIPAVSEEIAETTSTTEVEEVPYGNSFGQSAGLKDDLDVEDDGIGNAYRMPHNFSGSKETVVFLIHRREEEGGIFGLVNRVLRKWSCIVRRRSP